ncbi:ATP-binding protein [Kineosporia sp. NBRC 101731]|uniref:ATP-binding protein n=1 Tax=Kineosporia sp. NBRC 101731 TaxID=3032199 RepID=UPI0024A4C7C4|nr:hypothetical protein Kisp02_60420 [Kineosporia sp. NBRC 101731]
MGDCQGWGRVWTGPNLCPAGCRPAADRPCPFDRFWRAEASRSRDYGGSGLGLAIVQAIVKAHGGRVEVSSEVGRGTSVILYLPSGVQSTQNSLPSGSSMTT